MTAKTYKIVVAADGSAVSMKAIRYAINLSIKLNIPYKLDILYAVGLNPSGTTSFGLLSGLDRMNNVDIQEDAKENISKLNSYLSEYTEKVKYEVIAREEVCDVGDIIKKYTDEISPDMLVIGSSNKEGIQKFILGSVSDYCLHHCECPVTIIKGDLDK